MNSCRLLAGTLLATASTLGTVATTVTGTQRVGSKAMVLYRWWLMAIGPGGETSTVLPSGSARATNSPPILPPAPVRFSTTTPAG